MTFARRERFEAFLESDWDARWLRVEESIDSKTAVIHELPGVDPDRDDELSVVDRAAVEQRTTPVRAWTTAAPGDPPMDEDDSVELCALLERASRRLDRMWKESWGLRDPSLWLRLREASCSLHRTVIVLREQP